MQVGRQKKWHFGHGVADGVKPVKQRVRTIDMAPTLAVLLGLTVPGEIDGVVLRDVFPEVSQSPRRQ